MEDEMTVINVKKTTKERFDKLGSIGMSQDQLQNALIDFWLRYKDVVKAGR